MTDEYVIRIGCLRIVEHFIAGVVKEKLAYNGVGFPGFKLNIPAMNSFKQLSDELIAGKIEGAFLPLPFALDLFRKGLDINFLMFVNRGGGAFIQNTAAGIKRLEDFKNKTILTPCYLSVQNMLLHKLFSSKGMNLGIKHQGGKADVFLEQVPLYIMGEVIDNDSDHEIGGFIATEPFDMNTVKKGNCKLVCELEALWRYYPGNVFVIKKNIIEKRPDSINEILNLFIETGEKIGNPDHDNLIQTAESFLMQDKKPASALLARAGSMFDTKRLGPDSEIVTTVQDYMVDQTGLLKEKIVIEDFVNTFFTDKLRR